MEYPLISIIIPVYNTEKYIKQSVESALSQTYENIEVIVVDDGSDDKTKEIIASFNDNRLIYFYQKNQGLAVARNSGIKKSKGEYITFLDADDFYLTEKVEKEYRFLKNNPRFDLVYCNLKHFYDDNPTVLFQHEGPFYSGDIFKKLLKRFFGQMNTIMLSRKILDEVGLFDDKMKYSEDWDLMLRISKAGFEIGFLDEDLLRIRIRRGSLSNMANQWIMKEHNLYLFDKLFKSMDEKKRREYGAEKILKILKLKLAAAYLVAGRKSDFNKIMRTIPSNFIQRILSHFFIAIIFLIPASILQFIIIKIWQLKQRLLFVNVDVN